MLHISGVKFNVHILPKFLQHTLLPKMFPFKFLAFHMCTYIVGHT